MLLSRTVLLGFIWALALSFWTGCLQNSNPEESCSKEAIGPRDSTLIFNRKWVPTDTFTPEGWKRWKNDAMYFTTDSLSRNGSLVWYPRKAERFACSNNHPDTCYARSDTDVFKSTSDSYLWSGGWAGGGPGEWEFTTATPERLSLRTQKKSNSPEWNCTETFKPTQRIFADTMGGTLKIYP